MLNYKDDLAEKRKELEKVFNKLTIEYLLIKQKYLEAKEKYDFITKINQPAKPLDIKKWVNFKDWFDCNNN